MKKLTAAEEQVMQALWELEKAFAKEVLETLAAQNPEEKPPAYNTVSTIIRILEKKGFVAHETFGKSHRYYPIITKEAYSHAFLKGFIGDYFGGSFEKMVSFFVKKDNPDLKQVEDLLQHLEAEKEKSRKNTDSK